MKKSNKDEDDERFWNLVMFKMYATDKEMEEVYPIALIVVFILILCAIIWMSI